MRPRDGEWTKGLEADRAGPGFSCFHVPWLVAKERGARGSCFVGASCTLFWLLKVEKRTVLGGSWGVSGWIAEILGKCNSMMDRVMVGLVCTVFTDFR